MKLIKPLAGVVLTGALALGLWSWLHQSHPQLVAKPVAQAVKPEVVTLPKPVPANLLKMVAVVQRPAFTPSKIPGPGTSGWSSVQKIIDDRLGYEVRLAAIQALSPPLTEADWTKLKKFLLLPDAMDQIQLGQVIKNQLLDTLCALNPPPAGLGEVLAQMYANHNQNEVIRDYAVQHMGAYYEQESTQPKNANALQSVQNVLWQAVNETSDSVGGTALLALKRLSQEYQNDFDPSQIAATALQMAGDNSAGELTQITAYQVCAQLGTPGALPVVLQAAQTGETISVRMSAIGALGLLGGPDQVPFLNSVLNGPEDRLKPAARHALEQINGRQNLSNG